MDTEIRFLKELEGDLSAAAMRERHERVRPPRGPRFGGWRRVAAAAAAILVVAWGIGFVVQHPIGLGSSDEAADFGSGGGAATEAPVAPADDAPGVAPGYAVGGEEVAERDGLGFEGYDGGDTVSGGGSPAADRDLSKIVRDGRIRVKVPDGSFREARDEAVAVAEEAGGFVLESSVRGRSGTFVLRVPARRFDGVMTRLARLGDVELEEQRGEDVTAEYIDLQARIDILTARRDVIRRLMERATSLSQTLMLQNRFDQVQLELEQLTGRIRYLDDQVAESTVRLEIVERTAPQAQVEPELENPSLLRAWQQGVHGFLNVVSVAVVGLGYLLPILIVGAAWLAVREVLRRRRA
ncbi:MAG TPA: DUF4349 domain-containing protein [Actinomycetota bacterium]